MWLGARIQEILSRRKKFLPRGHELAGRKAEVDLLRVVEAGISDTHWRVWDGVRIPNKTGRKREVDLIILGGPKLLLVEQKHWSGGVEIETGPNGEEVIQIRRSGERMNHRDVFGTIALKAKVLALHHNASEGFVQDYYPLVVFSNPNLEIPEDMLQRPDCFEVPGLIEMLPGGGADVGAGLDLGQLAIASTLDRLGSWDVVHLHGGDAPHGDVHGVSGDSGTIHAIFSEQRDEISHIEVQTDRRILPAIFKRPRCDLVIHAEEGVLATCAVNPNGELIHRNAGSRAEVRTKWRHIEKIILDGRDVGDESPL